MTMGKLVQKIKFKILVRNHTSKYLKSMAEGSESHKLFTDQLTRLTEEVRELKAEYWKRKQ